METRLKDTQSQLATRQRRVSELEQAAEQSNALKVRGEKELQTKLATTEAKATEAATRLAAFIAEKKNFEAKHLKEIEDLNTKQKAEIERREQVKAQEVKRLQESVQEKSKQLKVVELELARYKNKPAGAPAAPRPAAPAAPAAAARPPASNLANSFLGEDEEQATRVNMIPVDVPVPARPAAAPAARPAAPAAAPPRPAAAPPRPPIAITAAPAQKRVEKEDRTVVMPASAAASLPPAQDDDDVDFSSIVDNLGKG
jgi:hypothetical protein